jgi:diguanylate cyclase (GGDEF)-like protein/PAS domain S-box-containing protein
MASTETAAAEPGRLVDMPRGRPDPLLMVVVGTTLVAALWHATGWGGESVQVIGFWVIQIALDVVFCVLAGRVGRTPGITPAMSRFWWTLVLAGAFCVLADSWQASVTIRDPVMASTGTGEVQANVLALGGLVAVIAMAMYPVQVLGRARLRFVLDTATTLVGAAVYVWYFSLSQVTGSSSNQVGSLLVGSAVQLTCTFAVVRLMLSSHPPMTRRAAGLGIAGLALTALSTGLSPMLTTSSHPQLALAARLLPCVLIAIMPRVQELQLRALRTVDERHQRRPYSLVPYVAVASVQVLLGALLVHHALDARAAGVLIGVVVITVLVMVRQLVSFEDNASLLAQLDVTLQTVQHQEERFRSLVQHASDIIAVLDCDGQVQYVSPAVERLLGIDAQTAQSKRIHELTHPDDTPVMAHFLEQVAAVPGGTQTCDVRLRTTDDQWRWLGIIGTNLLAEPGISGIVCNARDITESRSLQDRLHHEVNHDPLTGLANRLLFQTRLSMAARDHREQSILLIDLDDFKPVNDLLGHHAGDAVLKEVASRLRASSRASDTVARLGGDEFAVFLPGASAADAERAIERIRVALSEPLVHEGTSLALRASIGAATAAPGDAEALLRAADGAMYVAKRQAKQEQATTAG